MTSVAHEKGSAPWIPGEQPLTIETLWALAKGHQKPSGAFGPSARERIDRSAAVVADAVKNGRALYGVTTGFGASVEFRVDPEVAHRMPLNLLRYHGCGTGAPLSPEESAAVVAARLASLGRGWSGVRPQVLELMIGLLDKRVLPVIPEEGSVGASGDLTPLSYLAATLVGERHAYLQNEIRPAAEALSEAGLSPVGLAPKESLAILNGTSVMAALASLAFMRASKLSKWASRLTAMAVDVLHGNRSHFDDRIFALKPHPGQRASAQMIHAALARDDGRSDDGGVRVQDPYSLRCAPHVIGVLADALPFMRQLIEVELNGVSDNPLLDPSTGDALHGGNFYGGHVCLATDTLKNTVANVADLLDRQLLLLCSPRSNTGLGANLVHRADGDRYTHHGFKAMEITASALTAEALKMAGPASVFSRSTESHNQDKVSMGSISAREARRILDLTETVAAVHTLALCQAVDIRGPEHCTQASREVWASVREVVAVNDGDRAMDGDIVAVLELYRSGQLKVEL